MFLYRRSFRVVVISLAASLFCGCIVPAQAAGAEAVGYSNAATRTVSFADLNLSKPADTRVLYHRIESAARFVCAGYESRDTRRKVIWRNCYETAIAGAIQRVSVQERLAVK